MRAVMPIDAHDRALAEQLVDLQRRSYAVEAELMGFDGIPPLYESVDDLIAADLIWEAVLDDLATPIAAIAFAWLDDGTLDIDRLVVHPDHFRRGHGRRLVEAALAERARRVVVSTGTANMPARCLYEGLGFQVALTTEIAPGITTTQYELVR